MYDVNVGLGRDKDGHRWSGWPGAWCHYCGIEDPREALLADGHEEVEILLAAVEPCKATPERKEAVDREMNPSHFA